MTPPISLAFLACISYFIIFSLFLKVFIESLTILLLFYVLVCQPWDMCDLNSLIRDHAHTLSIRRQRLNHWTTREIPFSSCFYFFLFDDCLDLTVVGYYSKTHKYKSLTRVENLHKAHLLMFLSKYI